MTRARKAPRRRLGRLAGDFDETVARATVWLAAVGVGAIVGLMAGAVAHTLWPAVDSLPAQGAGALVGMALGGYWCATLGRAWMARGAEDRESNASSHPEPPHCPPS